MTYYSGTTSTTPAGFQDWLRNCLVNEPGWSVLYWKAADSGGRTVTAFRNTDHNFTLLTFYTTASGSSANSPGSVCVAEDYDFAAGTVTNPAVFGAAIAPLSGDRAFSAPLSLGTVSTAFVSMANSGTQNGHALIASRDFVTFGWRTTQSLSPRYNFFSIVAFDPMAPSLEQGPPVCFQTAGSGVSTIGVRVTRSPLSSSGPAGGVNWTSSVVPWHTAADWGADAYAPDATALPSTRAVLFRTNGGADGLGISRGLLKGFRFGSGGTHGQQMTDEDGDVWRYEVAGNTTNGVSPLTGWWRVA